MAQITATSDYIIIFEYNSYNLEVLDGLWLHNFVQCPKLIWIVNRDTKLWIKLGLTFDDVSTYLEYKIVYICISMIFVLKV